MKRDRQRPKKHVCRLCGYVGQTHIHHIFGGRWRRISERYNFVIELCPRCHEQAHNDAAFARILKRDCQLEFVWNHSQEEWMELMGRNWIEPGEVYRTHKVREHVEGIPYTAADFDDEEID